MNDDRGEQSGARIIAPEGVLAEAPDYERAYADQAATLTELFLAHYARYGSGEIHKELGMSDTRVKALAKLYPTVYQLFERTCNRIGDHYWCLN